MEDAVRVQVIVAVFHSRFVSGAVVITQTRASSALPGEVSQASAAYSSRPAFPQALSVWYREKLGVPVTLSSGW